MLDDLTAAELAMLGHSLRVVPGNACLTNGVRQFGVDAPLAFFHEIPAYQSLWAKVAEAVRERDDLAPFRPQVPDGR